MINRPEGRNINLIKVKAMVFDGDGLETIKWVGFTLFSLRDNEMMNNGNMIFCMMMVILKFYILQILQAEIL